MPSWRPAPPMGPCRPGGEHIENPVPFLPGKNGNPSARRIRPPEPPGISVLPAIRRVGRGDPHIPSLKRACSVFVRVDSPTVYQSFLHPAMCDQLNSMLRVTPHVSMHRTDGHQRFNYLSGATRVMRPHTLRALFFQSFDYQSVCRPRFASRHRS